MFVQRAFGWLGKVGTMAVVTPQELVVPDELSQAAREVAEGADVERRREAWRGSVVEFERVGHAVLLTLGAAAPVVEQEFFGIDVSTNRGERLILLDEKAALLRGEVKRETQWQLASQGMGNARLPLRSRKATTKCPRSAPSTAASSW